MVLAVAAAFWVGKFTGATTEGLNSMALQQGALGLILTVLIVTAPPMAASFFQVMLGAFTPSTSFISAGGARASRAEPWSGGNRHPPGHGGDPGGAQPVSPARAANSGGSRGAKHPYYWK